MQAEQGVMETASLTAVPVLPTQYLAQNIIGAAVAAVPVTLAKAVMAEPAAVAAAYRP